METTHQGFDESIAAALCAQHPDAERREMLSSLGLPTTILAAVALGIALKAAAGDVSAAKFLREVSGGGSALPDTDLAPYSDEELRALIHHLQEDSHDTRREAP